MRDVIVSAIFWVLSPYLIYTMFSIPEPRSEEVSVWPSSTRCPCRRHEAWLAKVKSTICCLGTVDAS